MEKFDKIKRKQNSYRLNIFNEDTYEELATFKINRFSFFIVFSTIIVFIISFTIILISFTPLRFYIPGYGSRDVRTTYELIKIKSDSLEKVIYQNDQYLANIKKILDADKQNELDTTSLKIIDAEIAVE